MKSLTVPSSNLAKASVCVTAVMWFSENLKQKSSSSCACVKEYFALICLFRTNSVRDLILDRRSVEHGDIVNGNPLTDDSLATALQLLLAIRVCQV